ncbi:MAG: META domain-containing protein [Guyparkeria sp.]|uniref:META domain-containing protein n=1 Tax=Guyparkeria sp. TaxID=2035736 RepID=UPI00397A7027
MDQSDAATRKIRHLAGAGILLASLTPLALSAADRPPVDSQWRLANIVSLQNIDPTLTDLVVDADGNIGGVAACNDYRRDWDGDEYGDIAVTRKTCGEERMEQEEAFLEAVRKTVDWQVDGERLLLKDADGRNLAVMLEPITRSYHFDCEGKEISFDVIRRGQIRLFHDDQDVLMSRTESASGSRYESEDGNVVFWGKGQEGTFEVDGEKRDCRQVPNPDAADDS